MTATTRVATAPIALAGRYDVAIVGAGPAGLAAATVCADAGLATLLLDEQPSVGGQIYRGITETPLRQRNVLGAEYWHGETLTQRAAVSSAQHVPGSTVWSLSADGVSGFTLGVSLNGGSSLIGAQRVILATGAIERPMPIPGWTLPGVMTVGGAQILLKSSGMVPAGRTVLAGCGPLLWLLAWQYLNAGASIDMLLDTTPRGNARAAWRHLPSFMVSPYFRKGLALMWSVRRRFPVVHHVTELRAEGAGTIERVVYRQENGAECSLSVDTLLLHQGVAPNVNLAMSAQVEHRWDDEEHYWRPVLDADGSTSVPGLLIAGDGAGIAGAEAAEQRGLLCGLAVVRALRPQAAPPVDAGAVRATLAVYERGRRFVDALYSPAARFRQPQGNTVVCRCEEVTAKQVIETVALGCPGPNQMKSFLRCGMGPCQGRLCGLTVTELMAMAGGVSPQQIGYYRLRPPVKPITVAELANLPQTAVAIEAVVRP